MSLLMEHNVPVYEEFCKCLEENHECILITATGTGKSYIVEEFLQQHNEVALVVVPRVSIKQSWEELSSNVSVVTYQWFSKHYKELIDRFVYVVFDEAHHIGGDGPWGEAVRDFKDLSTNTYFIGLTADSVRYTDKNKDVAEREFDGHIVYGYELSEAINLGILPNAKYVTALFDVPSIRKSLFNSIKFRFMAESNIEKTKELFGRLDMAMKNTMSIDQILRYHLDKLVDRKGIVFVDSIDKIMPVVSLMRKIFKRETILYIHSNLSQEENKETIELFKSLPHGYIVTVDMFNEGVHIDGVNTIIMLRKTHSPSLYKQQIGRALSSSNSTGQIYVFDFVGNSISVQKLLNQISIDSDSNSRVISITPERSKTPIVSMQCIIDECTSEILHIISDIEAVSAKPRFSKRELKEIISRFSSVDELQAFINTNNAARLRGLIRDFGFSEQYGLKNYNEIWDQTKEIVDLINKRYEEGNPITVNEIVEITGRQEGSVRAIIKNNKLRNKILKKIYDPEYKKAFYNLKSVEEAMIEIPKQFPSATPVSIYQGFYRFSKAADDKRKERDNVRNIVDKVLIEHYEDEELPDIIKKYLSDYDIDKSYLRTRVRTLGLGTKQQKLKEQSDRMHDLIKQQYRLYGPVDIITHFNLPFTQNTIKNYAYKIGVKFDRYNSPEVVDFIKKYYKSLNVSQLIEIFNSIYGIKLSNTAVRKVIKRIIKEEAQ